jgi:hypothetical protein
VEALEKDPTPFVKYLVAETGGLLEPHEFTNWRLLHGPPTPYTRERWDDTYNWTVKWDMTVPGATYENTVDNRAWDVSDKVTVAALQQMKRDGRKIVGVVAWDYQIARSPTAPAWTSSPSATRSASTSGARTTPRT